MITVREALQQEMGTVRELFQEYAAELGVDLCFQSFAEELAALPWLYARPKGFIYLAYNESEAVACIALKPLSEKVCEMKRLYVKPSARGVGIAQTLAETCLLEAGAIGYEWMNLDTLRTMSPAISLYTKLGFAECAPYYSNPLPGVIYMSKQLQNSELPDIVYQRTETP